MKKLVALAVAGAFIAPVYAAEVSVSGKVEFHHISTNAVGTAASTSVLTTADGSLDITAKETVNGVIFTGVVRQDEAGSDGATLTIAFPNGFKVGVGEQNGALDSVGAYSDIAPQLGGQVASAVNGDDHPILVTLPSFAGFTAYISHSPKDNGTAAIGTVAARDSYAVKYAFPNGEVFYGVQNNGGAAPVDISSYGVKYSIAGVTIGYETGTTKSPTTSTVDADGLSLSYKMGDIVLGIETNKVQSEAVGAAATHNNSVMFAEYNLGSSIDIYAVNESSSASTVADRFAVGIEYSF